ncbi:hypothetical protein GIB67_015884 [Kingdonia uniflora]|uniref:Proline dehydrogenase n=1 Tax=Kingdonia uniflora TaxID=39325 RepID=A0A7J7NHG8_9MAGN|nr:hypothetical protein GIB67_015884 [Kingdonia uniflora]
MAIRVPPKLIITLPYTVRFMKPSPTLLTTVLPLSLAENIIKKPVTPKSDDHYDQLLDLNDTNKLFSSVSTTKLFRSLINLNMASFEPLVDFGIWIMKSSLMETMIIRDVILKTVKHTFYEHFCAGENLNEARRTLQALWDDGLKGILDYGLEDAVNNESCDRNLNEFLKTVESTKLLPQSSVSYACVKITAICPISLLNRVSNLLRWEKKDPSFNLPWKVHTLPIFSKSSPFYHTLKRPDPLTPQEQNDLEKAHQRLIKLSEKCFVMDLPLLVDAEYTMVQPAIDYFTYSAMLRFNKNGKAIVYGTVQAYLRDSKERVIQAAEAAEKMGVTIGFKLVRGAYLSTETKVASSLGYASPIHGSIEETHACYDECASFMLEKVHKGTGAVCLATHNLESGRGAATKARALGIGKGDDQLQFAQLKGMAEGLSFGLRNAGFQVSKYLPYGPVDMVIPYLLRRAEENRGMLSASTLDRQLMRKEIKRRLTDRGEGFETRH